jgi:hypothetical protein
MGYSMKVSRVPWEPDAYLLTGSDYIFGMLLEIPEMYYITPSRQLVYLYVYGRGMVKLYHDFTQLTDSEAALVIYHIRRQFEIH